jgi:hypothetical protein
MRVVAVRHFIPRFRIEYAQCIRDHEHEKDRQQGEEDVPDLGFGNAHETFNAM